MANDDIQPNLSYTYHTYNPSQVLSPAFVLLYIQCFMFILNGWCKLGLNDVQLYFPTLMVLVMILSALYNNIYGGAN